MFCSVDLIKIKLQFGPTFKKTKNYKIKAYFNRYFCDTHTVQSLFNLKYNKSIKFGSKLGCPYEASNFDKVMNC